MLLLFLKRRDQWRMPEGTRTKKAAGSSRGDMMDASRGVGGMYVKVVPPPDVNKNTSWFQYPGVWTTYILIIFISWLLILSVFGCDAGTAWTVVNLAHFAVSPTTVLTSCACMYIFFFLPKLITRNFFPPSQDLASVFVSGKYFSAISWMCVVPLRT